MTATKMVFYSNPNGGSAQIHVDQISNRATLARFNAYGSRVELRQPKFRTEAEARQHANEWHGRLISSGFRVTEKR